MVQDSRGGYKGSVPSPAYQVPEEGVWNQSYLAKALQNMKETDFPKLRFNPDGLSGRFNNSL